MAASDSGGSSGIEAGAGYRPIGPHLEEIRELLEATIDAVVEVREAVAAMSERTAAVTLQLHELEALVRQSGEAPALDVPHDATMRAIEALESRNAALVSEVGEVRSAIAEIAPIVAGIQEAAAEDPSVAAAVARAARRQARRKTQD